MKTRVSLKYFVSYFVCKLFFDSNTQQIPSNLVALVFSVTLGLCHWVNLKLEQLSEKKFLNVALLGNCFSHLLTEVEIWY